MPDNKIPISSLDIATSFDGAKAVVPVPDRCNQIELIAIDIDVFVALRDTDTDDADDRHSSVDLDTDPNTKAVLVVAEIGAPFTMSAPAGKQPVRSGAVRDYPHSTARSRGFLHYKPTGASGTGRLIINFYQ